MNVLVYSGPEVLQSSLSRSLSSLRAVLYPNYTVQAITLQSLTSQPWTTSCALLVIPACRDRLSLPSTASSSVKSYVESGGAFLGLRAVAKASGDVLGIIDPSEYAFRFLDRKSGSSLYVSFLPGGEEYSRRVTIQSSNGHRAEGILETAVAGFGDVGKARNVRILAKRIDGEGSVAVSFETGAGRVVVWGVHIEAPIATDQDAVHEERRRDLLRQSLAALDLQLPSHMDGPSSPLPQFLTCSPSSPDIVRRILDSLSVTPQAIFEDSHDTFQFHDAVESANVVTHYRTSTSETVRHIVVHADGSLPSTSLTPYFDIKEYFVALEKARSKEGCHTYPGTWGIGEAFMYGEVVTSTQTLFDKNPKLLSRLPSPILSLATHQLAGRGRTGNAWVSPWGCLQFSLRLRVSLADLPATRLVFIQYLFALAVIEACRDDDMLGAYGDRVRVKWPNDVYVTGKQGLGQTTKVAGILVYTAFEGGAVDIIVGCGLNVNSPPPIASLASLLPDNEGHTLSMERMTAIIMAKFDVMWDKFLINKGSFEPFMDLYLDRWLHSDQVVTLTTTSPHRRVRIVGITSDYGLLRTVPEGGVYSETEQYIDLQPDGNTFDLMAGLIMTKAR